MKKVIFCSQLILLAATFSFAAGERIPAGSRAAAMGGTSVTACDVWSVGNNPAGAAFIKSLSIGAGAENRFLLKELLQEQVALAVPWKAGTFGLFMTRSGNSQFNEIKAGLSFARKFGKQFSAAIQVDYLRIHIANDYGNRNMVSCEIGLMYHPDRRLSIGMHLLNPVPVKLTGHPAEYISPVICLGLSYRFSDEFTTALEAGKDLDHPLVFRAGAEYRLAKIVYARIGISTAPLSFSFGCGMEIGKVRVDIASGYHQELGFSPTASISYSIH